MLQTSILLNAYREGIFPMAINAEGDVGWFSPDPRGIIPLDERFHIPHSLRRVLKKEKFEITVDRTFDQVIRACAKTHGDTWISPAIESAYCRLHREGHAHSVETWHECELVGGLYGVHLGAAFFGESMFHRETDASKVALVALVDRLRDRNFLLLDAQWLTPHLATFGASAIPRATYLRWLRLALRRDCQFV